MRRPRAVAAVALVAGATSCASTESLSDAIDPAADAGPTVRRSVEPHRRRAPRDKRFTIARIVRGSVSLRARPGARAVARAGARTEFGSPTALAVAARRGRWLGVESSDVPNAKLAWVDSRSRALVRRHTRVSVRIDLNRRRLALRDGRRVVDRARIGTGSRSSPTPTGRFAVTDKLAGGRFSRSYGCCVLALSGHQTKLPPGWNGGNRLAIHGTDAPATIGRPASAGCLHARRKDLEKLMRRVPLGAPVFIEK
jgi:hypothetical protein